MRCPKCGALAADSDSHCLWCGKRLNHSRSAPPDPTRPQQRGGGPGLGRLSADGVGAVLMVLGMLFGSWVAAGADTAMLNDLVKPAVAASCCCGIPALGLCLLVRWLRTPRRVRRDDSI